MEITYLGHSSFRLKGKTMTIVTDPFDSDMVGLKYPKGEADIVTVSHSHLDHSKVDQITSYKKVISGPGEYEIEGVSIIGLQTYHDTEKGAKRGKNTVYVIEIDGLRVCHLGDLGHTLSDEQIEDIGTIDVLLIPVGGEFTIGSEEAVQVIQDIEPGVIIPMHYQMPGLEPELFSKLAPVDQFVTQIGSSPVLLPKLVVKQGEVIEGEQKLVILEKKS